jgi:hypothetical protein
MSESELEDILSCQIGRSIIIYINKYIFQHSNFSMLSSRILLQLSKSIEFAYSAIYNRKMDIIFMFFNSKARRGLSESELEDILSCDDDVLNDVYAYWTPPVRRLPPLLLVRLKTDLSQYLGRYLHLLILFLANPTGPWTQSQD